MVVNPIGWLKMKLRSPKKLRAKNMNILMLWQVIILIKSNLSKIKETKMKID